MRAQVQCGDHPSAAGRHRQGAEGGRPPGVRRAARAAPAGVRGRRQQAAVPVLCAHASADAMSAQSVLRCRTVRAFDLSAAHGRAWLPVW